MVIFPEGTRYNVNLPNVIQRSRQYAIDNGKFVVFSFKILFTLLISAIYCDCDQVECFIALFILSCILKVFHHSSIC